MIKLADWLTDWLTDQLPDGSFWFSLKQLLSSASSTFKQVGGKDSSEVL